jgi:hypothetical protein
MKCDKKTGNNRKQTLVFGVRRDLIDQSDIKDMIIVAR